MNDKLLEKVYETVILPNYPQLTIESIRWSGHDSIGADAWAHYFSDAIGAEYVLLFEDYPGGTFEFDDVTHEIIKAGDRTHIRYSLDVPFKHVENLTGYFSLYKL